MSNGFSNSSVGRKVLMALSGFFLISFLILHFVINFLSVFSADLFNMASHFMGTNWIIQFLMQPILLFGVLFHLGMGMNLELKNRAARPIKYAMNKAGENSTWISRNMLITGVMVFLFLGLHFYDFWIPEIKDKFIDGMWDNPTKYFPHLVHKFEDPIRVALYCVSFIFLGLHLLHGFQSAFVSAGFRNNKYTPMIKTLGNLFAVVVPLGFIFIAIYHHLGAH